MEVFPLELTKKTMMADFVNHVESIVKFNKKNYKSVRFRVNDQNKHIWLYIKDYFNPVKYIKYQNEHFCYTLRSISMK